MRDECAICGFSNGDDSLFSCKCEDMEFEWVWDRQTKESESCLFNDEKTLMFHPIASNGTVVVRGTEPMTSGIHYWEMKITTHLYGTDVMFGVGEKDLDIFCSLFKYTSFLGKDERSCGHSYLGNIQYGGKFNNFRSKDFAEGSVVGCLLNMFYKKLYFFVDREPSGSPITLTGNAYYPMVCSTAARTGLKLIYTRSFEANLENLIIIENNLPSENAHHRRSHHIKKILKDRWPLFLPNRKRIVY